VHSDGFIHILLEPSDEPGNIGNETLVHSEGFMHSFSEPLDEAGDIRNETPVHIEGMGDPTDTNTTVAENLPVSKLLDVYRAENLPAGSSCRFAKVAQNSTNKLKNRFHVKLNKWKHFFKGVANAMPVIMGPVLLILMVVDQFTDIASSYEICNVPCKCVLYNRWGTCSLPEKSRTEDNSCVTAKGNYSDALDYCSAASGSEFECNDLPSWIPTTPQHLAFCVSSIGTILVPSIINSTYFFIRLWYIYPSVLRYIGLSYDSRFFSLFIKSTLLALYILQLLPYV
ncbi:unnamed protein product, partial [Meganyctiphanes norvegica]